MLNIHTAHRNKLLGNLGEFLAQKILSENLFSNISNLNEYKTNYPFADFYAERNGINYVISVKIRNKYEYNIFGIKKINSCYRLGSKCYQHASNAETEFSSIASWLAISLDELTYTGYFGLLRDLNGSRGIKMSERYTQYYECLCKDVQHGLDYNKYKNIY